MCRGSYTQAQTHLSAFAPSCDVHRTQCSEITAQIMTTVSTLQIPPLWQPSVSG